MGEAPIALYLGRLQARKGLDVLVQAFREVNIADSRLLLVGPDEGMMPALRALAAGDSRIIFTDYLDGDARLEALAAGDVFALPATGEGQPMAALEAMAAGLPVLLSPGCHMDEVAECGAGYVAAANVGAFADKLRLLLRDAGLRRDMGAAGRQLVHAKYSWDKIALELDRVYAGLL